MSCAHPIALPSAALALALLAGAPCSADDALTPGVEHNGVRYRVDKIVAPDGTARTIYSDGVRSFTPDELRAHVAAHPPRIITPALAARLAAARAAEPLDVVVVLRAQPAAPIARDVWAAVTPEVQRLAAAMRDLTAGGRARISLPREAERLVIEPPLAPREADALRALASARDDLERDARRLIAARIADAVRPDQDAMAQAVAALGGTVTARVSVANIVGARLPASRVALLAAHPLVAVVDLDHPGEPELDNSRLALGVDVGFWANGITGGVFDAGVLDTGVQQNHPALSSHPFLSNMGVSDTGTHGTLIAGIMASTDATNRGMAFGLDRIVMALAGSITTSMPGLAYIASTGEPENTNYSFGNGTANTADYTPTDQFFDGVIDTFGFMVSKSTGNGGFGSGAPTITHPAPAYNLLACANLVDQNTPTRLDDRISSSSSRGPTFGGRRKPDIAAPGTSIVTCNANWAGGSLWSSCSGTSCAAPHVGGAIILMFDAGVPDVAAAKAILLNTTDAMDDMNTSSTADDVFVPGSFWNRRYGWGYMNLATAYIHRADVFVDTVRDQPPAQTFRLYAGQMFQHEKATLTWQRHVAYNGAAFPTQIESLSDLDLLAYRHADNVLVASSTSAIDNVEQFSASADAFVVLKVKAAGPFDPDVPEEKFALATEENFIARTGPAFQAPLSHPAIAAPGAQFLVTVDVTNAGDLAAHGVTAAFSGVTVVSGPNPASLGALAPGASAQVQWTVEAPATAGPAALNVTVSSASYGETFQRVVGSTVMIGAACYPDCNNDGQLNLADFGCFQTRFALADPYADCNGDGAVNLADFGCFQTRFAQGCP